MARDDGYANAHRESDAVGKGLGRDIGQRDEEGRSTLPASPLSHAHTVRSYLGEAAVAALKEWFAPKGPKPRKRRKA